MAINFNQLQELKEIIQNASNIVFFGGAGVSTASGIPDFRGSKGLYKYTPEEIISHSFFMAHQEDFYEFYWNKMIYQEAIPNACHELLAKFEASGKIKAIVTQNIDGLHQMANSQVVLELHGSVKRNYCLKCHKFYTLEDLIPNVVPKCSCGGIIKPDVVLYEEPLDNEIFEASRQAIMKADTLIVAGTSLVVYPAFTLIRYFQGKKLVIINLGITSYDQKADLVIDGKVEEYLNLANFK